LFDCRGRWGQSLFGCRRRRYRLLWRYGRQLWRRRRNLARFLDVATVFFAAARFAKIAGVGADDLRLDQDIGMFADQDEMFDIVTPDKNELALPVEVEGIDDAEARLAGTASRHAQPAAKGQAEHEQDEQRRNQHGNSPCCDHQRFIFEQSIHKGRHRATHPRRSFNCSNFSMLVLAARGKG
jgi:hypothetical protein